MLPGGGSGGGVLLADQGHEVGEVVVVGVGVVTIGGLVVGVGAAGSSVVMATPASSVLVGAVMAPPQAVVVHLTVIGTRGQMLWW